MLNLFKKETKGAMEEETEMILKSCENLIDQAFKASGLSFMDAIGDLDATTGAVFGGAMKLYRETKDLVLIQAKMMDKITYDLEKMKETNEELREQNKELLRLMQDLSRKIDK